MISSILRPESTQVRFRTLSGVLAARRMGMDFELDSPALTASSSSPPPGFVETIGIGPEAGLTTMDDANHYAILPDEDAVLSDNHGSNSSPSICFGRST